MYIYCDIDETLWDSIDAVLITLNRRYNTNYKSNDVTTWNFNNLYPNMTDEEIEAIFDSDEFFTNVKFKKDAEDWLRKEYENNNITLITKGNKINLIKKQKWFNEHGFENIPFIGLENHESKGSVDMTGCMFLDDCKKNLDESNAEYKILFENNPRGEWLQGWTGLRTKSFKPII